MPRAKTSSQQRDLGQPEVDFGLSFGGPALEVGRMDAKTFAPSLFAAASLIENASKTVFSSSDSVAVEVNADFRRGSFWYQLTAVAMQAGQQMLVGISISDIDTMLKWIGFRPGEKQHLFHLVRKYGPRSIERVETRGNGNVNIHIQGDKNTVIIGDVKPQVAKLYVEPAVRADLFDAVAPLQKPGITEFRAGPRNKPVVLLKKSELSLCAPPASMRKQLTDSTSETAVELLAPSFVEGNKWRISQGGEPFWATITDVDFIQRVDEGESFAKGDYLIVRMKTTAYDTVEGLEVVREIVEVIDHRPGARQRTMFEEKD